MPWPTSPSEWGTRAILHVLGSDPHFQPPAWASLGVSFGEDQAAAPDASGSDFNDRAHTGVNVQQDRCPVTPWLSQ